MSLAERIREICGFPRLEIGTHLCHECLELYEGQHACKPFLFRGFCGQCCSTQELSKRAHCLQCGSDSVYETHFIQLPTREVMPADKVAFTEKSRSVWERTATDTDGATAPSVRGRRR